MRKVYGFIIGSDVFPLYDWFCTCIGFLIGLLLGVFLETMENLKIALEKIFHFVIIPVSVILTCILLYFSKEIQIFNMIFNLSNISFGFAFFVGYATLVITIILITATCIIVMLIFDILIEYRRGEEV